MRFHFEDWFSHFIACFVTFLLLAQHCVICWNLIMTRRRQLCGWYSIESSLYMSIWFVKYNIREEILVTENGTRNYVIFNASFLTIYKTVPHWLYIILQTHLLVQSLWFRNYAPIHDVIRLWLAFTLLSIHVDMHSWASIHQAVRRLTARSCQVSKPRDPGLNFPNSYEIRQALGQHRCRDACQICSHLA